MMVVVVLEIVIQLGMILCLSFLNILIDFISCRNRNAGARVACGLIKLISSNGLNIKPTMSASFLTIIFAVIIFFY
jgi:hypothetical protein